jgi:hypothetical protein
MKKYLFIIGFVALLLFISCSKTNDVKEKKIDFIQVKVTSDDSSTPSGIVALFYLGNDTINKYSLEACPNIAGYGSDRIVYARRNDEELIYPISHVGGDELFSSENYGVCTFYWNELSWLYGMPQVNGKYVIFIKLDCGKYPRAYKEFIIDGNKSINVHIPSASDYSDCVNADWKITDYSGD